MVSFFLMNYNAFERAHRWLLDKTLSQKMLHQFVRQNRALLRKLVTGWQAIGAEGFAWYGPKGESLYVAGDLMQKMLLQATLAGFGRLVVAFPDDQPRLPVQKMLEAQASMLESLLRRERELEQMTAELMRSYDQLVAMYNVSQVFRSRLEPEAVLLSLLEQAVHLTGARRGCIGLDLEGSGEVRVLTYPEDPPEDESLIARVLAYVRRTGRVLLANAPAHYADLWPADPAPFQRIAVAPIRVTETVVGFLGLFDKPTDFEAGDQKLLSALADEGGALLERDRLYRELVARERMQRELEIAAQIQTGLLPKTVPQVPGADIAGASYPATEVGGDFYDFFTLPDGEVGLVLGDVTSKGVPAALFMAVTRALLRAAAPIHTSPRAALAWVNADLYDDLSEAGMFVTLFLARYRPAERELVAVNAGHSPVILYQEGEARLWEADGPPLGVLPELLSEDQTVPLAPGDLLVLLSDGFNEARNPAGEMLGVEPLLETVVLHAGESAAEIQEALLRRVAEHAQGTPASDDRTIVVLKSVRRPA